jgi:hypothetical protein
VTAAKFTLKGSPDLRNVGYIGEVSPDMLAMLNVRYVIARHSEWRAQCGATDEVVRDQVDAIYRHATCPIPRAGETAGERQGGVAEKAEKKVRRQVAAVLGDRPAEVVVAVAVAYEPVGGPSACSGPHDPTTHDPTFSSGRTRWGTHGPSKSDHQKRPPKATRGDGDNANG